MIVVQHPVFISSTGKVIDPRADSDEPGRPNCLQLWFLQQNRTNPVSTSGINSFTLNSDVNSTNLRLGFWNGQRLKVVGCWFFTGSSSRFLSSPPGEAAAPGTGSQSCKHHIKPPHHFLSRQPNRKLSAETKMAAPSMLQHLYFTSIITSFIIDLNS